MIVYAVYVCDNEHGYYRVFGNTVYETEPLAVEVMQENRNRDSYSHYYVDVLELVKKD